MDAAWERILQSRATLAIARAKSSSFLLLKANNNSWPLFQDPIGKRNPGQMFQKGTCKLKTLIGRTKGTKKWMSRR